MMLFGFASAMRRSELVALDVADLRFDAGLVYATNRHPCLGRATGPHKGGEGREVLLRYDPISRTRLAWRA
jgi:integrase